MIDQLAHVNQVLLVHRQIADRNVLQVANVRSKKLASIKNVEIHVKVLAVLALNAESLVTIQYAAVQMASLEIHLNNVYQNVRDF